MEEYNKSPVSPFLEYEIKNTIIPSMFPELNVLDRELLEKYIVRLINIIAFSFGFTDESYLNQLKQNNYQDIKWLICHLLPYINDSSDPKTLKSFSDLYVKKKYNVNINEDEPKYIYSNIQYNRFNRQTENYKERPFDKRDLEHNFYLLLETVKIMSNKMHVNWMDILPYSLSTYQTTNLYKLTRQNIEDKNLSDWDPVLHANININDEDFIKGVASSALALNINDIYNTITNDLYHNIKDIKWLIYDTILSSNNITPVVVVLEQLFGLKKCIQGIDWSDLEKEETDKFIEMYDNLVYSAEIGSGITYGSLLMDSTYLRIMLKGIILSFDKSQLSHEAERDKEIPYVSIEKAMIETENEDDEEDKSISFEATLVSLKSVAKKYIYEFFMDSLNKLKNTWYGTKIFTEDKRNILLPFQHFTAINSKIPLTYKNIYNFSKSLCHYVDVKEGIFTGFPNHWKSLNDSQQNEILKRLNRKYEKPMEWFNIGRYISHYGLNKLSDIRDIEGVNNEIHSNIMKLLTNIVFEVLIVKGVLTMFVPNEKKTNEKLTNKDNIYKYQNDVFDTSKSNPYWTSSYHWLTGLPYCYMQPFIIKDEGELVKYNYFTYGKRKGSAWYSASSYDWVAQIGFCHRFINNRVIFITGATGVGKSTEIPKLFLYYTKAIDYKLAGQVVCTQPRKAPAENNAEYVSTALGVPIYIYDKVTKKQKKGNDYYIQMSHRDDNHTKKVNHPMLRYVTDGTLILQVNDPVMKETKKVRGSKSKTPVEKYTPTNIYDIIMIDEAHEHKTNMDLLLTLLKYPITYNNSMRLVILSATMDEDEAKYRRYYRDVNDNKKYPLNNWIKTHNLDRINIDRRYHISAPGMTTKYKVEDIYKPGEEIVTVITDILTKSSVGDILVFQPGTAEINEIVNQINAVCPADVIAVPYHGGLNKDKRGFVERIHNRLKDLRISKFQSFVDDDIGVGNNSYSRAIIVATNAAEASITIASLKYVVETGTQKVNVYDYKKRGEKLIKTDISESSRIQRRGRVGRKASGTVYYLYEKGKMEKNKIAYEMATGNLYLNLFGKLKLARTEKTIINMDNDPNNKKTKLSVKRVDKLFEWSGLNSVLKSQFFIGNEYFDYYGNDEFYDYDNYGKMDNYYETGLSFRTLTDNEGQFYLIHPDELLIKRNICGKIVGVINTDNKEVKFIKTHKYEGYITSKKVKSFWQTLLDYLYIKFSDDKLDIIKTEIGDKIIKLFEDLKMENHNLFRALIFGIANGCSDEIVKLNVIYQLLNFNPAQLAINVDKKFKTDNIFRLTTYKTSDSKTILEILNSLHQHIDDIGMTNNISSTKYLTQVRKINELKKYSVEELAILLGPEDSNSKVKKDKFTETTRKKEIEKITQITLEIYDKYIENNNNDIENWARERDLNPEILSNYMKKYVNFNTMMSKKMTKETIDFLAKIKQLFLYSPIIRDRNVDPVELSLLMGFPFNVCKKINESKYYLSLYNPNFDNFYQIASFSKYKYSPNTFLDNIALQNYLLYLAINIETDSIICLHKIEPKLITILSHIYNDKHKSSGDHNYIELEKLINVRIKKYDETKLLSSIGPDLHNAIINYGKTLEEVNRDFHKYENSKTFEFIKAICNLDITIDKL